MGLSGCGYHRGRGAAGALPHCSAQPDSVDNVTPGARLQDSLFGPNSGVSSTDQAAGADEPMEETKWGGLVWEGNAGRTGETRMTRPLRPPPPGGTGPQGPNRRGRTWWRPH